MDEHCLSGLIEELNATTDCVFRSDEELARYTTLHIGGRTPLLIEIHSAEDAATVLNTLRQTGCAYRFLSGGSNVLIPDGDIPDVVIKAGRSLRTMDIQGDTLHAGAAMPLMTISRRCSAAGLSGFEFAAGIPAHIGGAVRMNAGAHGGELASILDSVQLAHTDGRCSWLKTEELSLSYRYCELPEGSMVVAARFTLIQGSREKSETLLKRNLDYRKKTQPLTVPSCGSVFKNPDGTHAAVLIESCGLKGTSEGGACISDLHANWIVNPERRASFRNVRDLIRRCQDHVQDQQGIRLQAEVDVWEPA